MGVEQIILALDYPNTDLVGPILAELSPPLNFWKVGLELYTAAGPTLVRQLKGRGDRVFLDLKLHDIPNTVAAACRQVADLEVDFLTVHACGGRQMLRSAVATKGSTKLLAVTLLTSLGESQLQQELGVSLTVAAYVQHLAQLAQECGVDGVVCSPLEIALVRAVCGPDFLIVTPGIRLAGTNTNDQTRTCSPAEALGRGADYLVVGRTLTQNPQPKQALQELLVQCFG